MLSRIALGLYGLGRSVERVQNVTRILEVNHKMHLQRSDGPGGRVWEAIAQSFLCPVEHYTERALYDALVHSETHPYSVRRCLREARDEGRTMREHISDEMWIHLNLHFLEFRDVSFDSVLEIGRSEFNRRIEVFCDALFGLADDTMIRGEAWAFLRLGKQMERALMICRILDIKRKSISSDADGAPADVHHWQALLRSLSGYAPYRRVYDARVLPYQVLEFVLKREDFPRSLAHALREMRDTIDLLGAQNPLVSRVVALLGELRDDLRLRDIDRTIHPEAFGRELAYLNEACHEIADGIELAYFTSLRPASVLIRVAPNAPLNSQQQQQQQ
jgi:uncharacterized alpha-E superfamily protein